MQPPLGQPPIGQSPFGQSPFGQPLGTAGGNQAATADAFTFDVDLLAKVQAEAIDFMLPRTLEPVAAAQLALWSLNGLTAIDPALTAFARDGRVKMFARGRLLLDIAAPVGQPAAWGKAVAEFVTAAYAASPAVRQLGQPAVTKALLDEMLAHLDPYSRYVPPIEAVGDRDRRVGQAGIGVTLTQRARTVVIRDVVIGSPGALAGLMPGDVVQWVDGHAAGSRDHIAVTALLSGPEGTDVRMGWISRDGSTNIATLTRVMIPPETVYPRRSGDVAIIRISGFSQTTDQHVALAVRAQMRGRRPMTGLVLDLRGNRGGALRAAVATADLFLVPNAAPPRSSSSSGGPSGGIIVRSAGRAPETNRIWASSDGGKLAKGIRMAVLVDGGTASAAEVLAAALADHGRAVVIGSATFGKGLVQTIDPLPDGGELFLTWSRLLAPRGWPIQSLGVLPQICSSLGEDALNRQLSALAAGKLEMAGAIAAHRAARAPVTPDQIVTIRERCPASDPRESDVAVAEALVGAAASHAAALLAPMGSDR